MMITVIVLKSITITSTFLQHIFYFVYADFVHLIQMVGWLVGWLGFTGTLITKMSFWHSLPQLIVSLLSTYQ